MDESSVVGVGSFRWFGVEDLGEDHGGYGARLAGGGGSVFAEDRRVMRDAGAGGFDC